MADTNHLRRDDHVGFSENDPFAELTRIMGHDPRVEEAPQAAVSAPATAPAAEEPALDDFSIDLEKELAGDFDFSDFDDRAPAADWRAEPAEAEPAQERVHEEAAAETLDDGFDTFFADAVEEAVAAEAPGDDLDDALERELFSAGEEWTAQPEAAEAPADEPVAQWTAPEAEIREPETGEVEESWATDAEFDLDFLEAELEAGVARDETVAEPQMSPAYEPGAYKPAAYEPPAHEPVAPEPVASEPAAFGHDEDNHDAPYASDEPASPPSLSLEEELSLLLADDPAPAPAPAPSTPEPTYTAARSAYGLANYAAAAAPTAVVASASAFARPQPTIAATPAYDEPEEPTPVQDDQAADTAFSPAYDAIAPQDLPADDFDFDLTLDDEPAAPETVAASPAASNAALPEIETVEVAETVPQAADDLDIPDIDYGTKQEAAPGPFDEFDAEFADVFGEVAAEEPAVAAAPVAASAAATAQPAQAEAAPPYMLDDAQWQAAQDFPETDLDYESDLERAIASSAYDDEEERPAPRRRGVMVAAAVAGVVALGGLGVFGMSMLGGGGDSPALVRADPEPMKVRPENPGGTTVPNQDNEVYQRVAGGAPGAAPEQEQLINSAEEPVDVAARTAPQEPALAPGIDDEAGALPAKSEDRIEPEEAAPAQGAEETAMVAPRRVRTMIVRPDGTMVPREAPAPAEAAATDQPLVAAAPPQLAVPGQTAPAGTLGVVPGVGAEAQPDEGPAIDMPETVAVVPTRRVEPQAAAAPAAPAAAAPARPATPAAAAPAATPVSAPAAAAPAGATSEWSMQIASQPTAEGAQSAYQDLARRYDSVLQGRGVNIVRADIEGRGTYYRVRIPASGRDEAIQLCTRYKAAGGSCFVSR